MQLDILSTPTYLCSSPFHSSFLQTVMKSNKKLVQISMKSCLGWINSVCQLPKFLVLCITIHSSNMSKRVQMCLIMSKYVQLCPNISKYIKTWQNQAKKGKWQNLNNKNNNNNNKVTFRTYSALLAVKKIRYRIRVRFTLSRHKPLSNINHAVSI